MFMLTVLVYPVVLALLCFGAGLLVDWAGGGVLPAMLLLTAGLAALIVASQLTTYVAPIASASLFMGLGIALKGFSGAIMGGLDSARGCIFGEQESADQGMGA